MDIVVDVTDAVDRDLVYVGVGTKAATGVDAQGGGLPWMTDNLLIFSLHLSVLF